MVKHYFLKKMPKPIEKYYDKQSCTFKVGKALGVRIVFPFLLDIDMARLCGMMPDGSLSKYLTGLSFCQGKDKRKLPNSEELLKRNLELSQQFVIMIIMIL